jgi:hypothetical protein
MFIYSSCGKWVFAPPLWSFPPSATLTSFPASGCWTCAPAPALSDQAQLVYLQFCEGFSSPPFWHSGCPHPLCNMSLLFLLLITQFLFFSWVEVSVCPGSYAYLAQGCLQEYHIPLSSPCAHLPKPSGHGCLAVARGPS